MADRFEMFSLNIFQITHYWNVLASEEMKPFGIKGISVLYLLALYHNKEGMTAAQLAQQCYRDKADVSRTISQFREKGLVEQLENQRYRARLVLTPKGEAVAAHLEGRAELALSLASVDLSEEEKASFASSLTIIANTLRKMSEDGLPKKEDTASE